MGGYTKTFILIAFMTALFMGVGFMLGGEAGMIIALIMASIMNFVAYWNADKMILSHYKAEEINPENMRDLYEITQMLVERAELPMPKFYLINQAQPNAFATGRNPNNAAIAVTSGLLDHCTTEEVAGVIAHELAHVKNHDMLIMTIAASFSGAISMLAHFAFYFSHGNNRGGVFAAIALMILAPMAAALVQMAISRAREFEADRIGAQISGRPEWLASALEKISVQAKQTPNELAEMNEGTAHLFIVDPLRGLQRLFATHPSTDERVKRLREMEIK